MKATPNHNKRIANLTCASVFPHYITKVEWKDRTKDELHKVLEWLTGNDENQIDKVIEEKVTFQILFERATLHPNAGLIKGVICGYRIDELENELTIQVRYLYKLVGELARDRKMEKILRQA